MIDEINYLNKLTAIQTAAKFLSASEVEELQKWEKKITGKGDIGTNDWPGWGAAIARVDASGLSNGALDIAGLRASLQRHYPDALKDIQSAPFTDAYRAAVVAIINSACRAQEITKGVNLGK